MIDNQTSIEIGLFCADLPEGERWPELTGLLNQLVQVRELREPVTCPACECLPTETVTRPALRLNT